MMQQVILSAVPYCCIVVVYFDCYNIVGVLYWQCVPSNSLIAIFGPIQKPSPDLYKGYSTIVSVIIFDLQESNAGTV